MLIVEDLVMKKYLCIDVGGSAIKYGIIQEDGTFLKESKTETCRDNKEKFIDILYHLYLENKEVDGIAFSMPGVIEVDTGFLRTAGAIVSCNGINLIDELHKFIDKDVRITVENDAKAATWAERENGALKDCNTGVMIVVGTGIGGTVMVDRKILRGANLFAGEFSFIQYNVDEPYEIDQEHNLARRCTPLRMRTLYERYTGIEITTEELFDKANAGDEVSLKVIREVARQLAMMICNLQCAVDPEVFAIGGGVSAQPLFIQMIQEETLDLANRGWRGTVKPNVVCSRYHNHANLLGALYFHLNTLKEE